MLPNGATWYRQLSDNSRADEEERFGRDLTLQKKLLSISEISSVFALFVLHVLFLLG